MLLNNTICSVASASLFHISWHTRRYFAPRSAVFLTAQHNVFAVIYSGINVSCYILMQWRGSLRSPVNLWSVERPLCLYEKVYHCLLEAIVRRSIVFWWWCGRWLVRLCLAHRELIGCRCWGIVVIAPPIGWRWFCFGGEQWDVAILSPTLTHVLGDLPDDVCGKIHAARTNERTHCCVTLSTTNTGSSCALPVSPVSVSITVPQWAGAVQHVLVTHIRFYTATECHTLRV